MTEQIEKKDNKNLPEKSIADIIEMAIYLILTGKSDFEASKQLGLSITEFHKLKASDGFMELYNNILYNIEKNITGKMTQVFSQAISKMQELMNSSNENIALEAATKILKIKIGNFESNANVNLNIGQSNSNNNSDNSDNKVISTSIIEDIVKRREERGLK